MFKLVDQQIAPRYRRGIDHGGEGLILVASKPCWLVWRHGRKYWSGVGQDRAYAQAALELVNANGGLPEHLFEGGRLTLIRIIRNSNVIDNTFGHGTTAHIDLRKTLLVNLKDFKQ